MSSSTNIKTWKGEIIINDRKKERVQHLPDISVDIGGEKEIKELSAISEVLNSKIYIFS